jgi:hypothetical protein
MSRTARIVIAATLLSLVICPESCRANPAAFGAEAASLSPLAGNYRGTLSGAISSLGLVTQGLLAAVDQSGRMTLTVPGLGTGTVTPNGQCRARIRFVINGQNVEATLVGSLVAIKSPSTGQVLAVVGVGTWRVNTPGFLGAGKWIIRQSAAAT